MTRRFPNAVLRSKQLMARQQRVRPDPPRLSPTLLLFTPGTLITCCLAHLEVHKGVCYASCTSSCFCFALCSVQVEEQESSYSP